jgi:23S rRNA pseudouridine1911/1915/1917 synthase
MEEDLLFFTISQDDKSNYKRLDQYLVDHIEDKSRSAIKAIFEKGMIKYSEDSPIQGKIELKKLPSVGAIVSVELPEPLPSTAKAENIPLEILFEDEHLVIVNKPAGMVTHPAPGNYTGTLVNAVLHHCPDLKGVGDEKRPGIVHRLDKGTSGVMVVAKNQKCHEGLVKLFSTHDIDRVYNAIVLGSRITSEGTLESTIGRHPQNRLKMAVNVRNGKRAVTHYKVLEIYHNLVLMQMKLETGRTHQIRVHLGSLLHKPILCDPLYGNPKEDLRRLGGEYKSIIKDYPHPFLHAKVLGFIHPITNEKLYFEADPPELFQKVIEMAESKK